MTRTFRRFAAMALLACVGITAATVPRLRRPRKPAKVKAVPVTVAGIDNAQALDACFDALKDLESAGGDRVVRIMQFGDSHTAADFLSGRVRKRLQGRFGDGGPGLVLPGKPWRGYPHDGVVLGEGRSWRAASLREKATDGLVGVTGAALFPPPGGVFRVRAEFGAYRVHLLAPEGTAAEIRLEEVADPLALPAIQGTRLPLDTEPTYLSEHILDGGLRLRVQGQAGLPHDRLQELSVACPPGSRLLGVDLRSGHPGVIYDELGLNGAELLDLEHWDPALRRELLGELHPDLLVLAYGTNDMGRTDLEPQDYAARAQALFETLKRESGAAILVVGPIDRAAVRRRQAAALRTGADRTIRALHQAALAAGCAFWDARAAMGGPGAMLRWRRAGLARPDLVHLTAPGYERLGNQLSDALAMAFERMERERESQ
jgi:lysophospholipase L1-like esterase